MGSTRFNTKEGSEVEHTSLSTFFEKQCPIYMTYGMTYDEFWYGDVYKAKFYRESYKLRVKQIDEQLWMQGMYIYEALCDVSPILHAFSKEGTKPLPYSDRPYTFQIQEKSEKEKEQEIKNARLAAQLYLENWAKATQKQFENKKGDD